MSLFKFLFKAYNEKKQKRREIKRLIVMLKDKDVNVRRKAADALGQINDRRATEALLVALEDKKSGVGKGFSGFERRIAALKNEKNLKQKTNISVTALSSPQNGNKESKERDRCMPKIKLGQRPLDESLRSWEKRRENGDIFDEKLDAINQLLESQEQWSKQKNNLKKRTKRQSYDDGIPFYDLRSEQEKRIETEAYAEKSLGSEIDKLVNELIEIGRGEGYLSELARQGQRRLCKADGIFNEDGENIRARHIGEILNQRGSRDLMVAAAYRVKNTLGSLHLSSAWVGIGGWQD
jgi:hypothetical protein